MNVRNVASRSQGWALMKKQMVVLAGLFFVTPLSSPLSADVADDFAAFKDQQNQGVKQISDDFEQYKKELEEGFAAYKQIYQDAFAAYKKDISQQWGEFKPGDKETWVNYDKQGVRTAVNFRSGEIEVELLVDAKQSSTQSDKQLQQYLAALLRSTENQAFKQDVVAQAVEQKLPATELVKRDVVSDKPIMTALFPVITTTDSPAVDQVSQKLIKSSKTDVRPSSVEGKKIIRMKVAVPVNAPEKAKQFSEAVARYSSKEKMPPTLIFAVIESESYFNPMAKSHIPAYGLMQIVPSSAGKDATAYLFGKAKILAPSYLYNGDNNIEIGSAYLHILYFNYLDGITDPVSRLYCTIAAYNTGAGNVARAFVGTTNISKATTVINRMSPKEVYARLRKKLPHDETRQYVKNVSVRMQKYQPGG